MYLIHGRLLIVVGVICYLVGRGVALGIKYKTQKQINWLEEVIKFLFVLYIFLVISVTMFPLALWIDLNLKNIKFHINLIPFVA
ncbi:MAG TPA: VanZ family protein, partial [Rummeliibacillus sp.]|nr:VanZ family protein [Rummeliibacillus sp.]